MYGARHQEKYNCKPKHVNIYLLREELQRSNSENFNQQKMLLKNQVTQLLSKSPKHYYFSTPLFKQWFITNALHILRWVFILDRLLIKSKPAVMIVQSEASIHGGILGLLSKKYNIPFINMPLLLIGDRTIIPTRADYYFVWGSNQKKWFMERNTKENKIFETGNIKFFCELERSICSKKYFLNELNIPAHHHIFGFTSQPFPDANGRIEEWINAIPNHLPVTILVKKHKNDPHEYPILNGKPNIRILPPDYALYEFLAHIDCLMTISSNTAIEAALVDKPLLILQPPIPYHYQLNHNQNNAHLVKAQAGEIIESANHLVTSIKKVIINSEYRNELKRKAGKFLSRTLAAVDEAPILTKSKIVEIISKN